MPLVAITSLTAIGTPASGPQFLASGAGFVHRSCCRERALGVDVQESVHPAVDGGDAVQVGLGHLDGGHLARRDQPAQLGGGRAVRSRIQPPRRGPGARVGTFEGPAFVDDVFAGPDFAGAALAVAALVDLAGPRLAGPGVLPLPCRSRQTSSSRIRGTRNARRQRPAHRPGLHHGRGRAPRRPRAARWSTAPSATSEGCPRRRPHRPVPRPAGSRRAVRRTGPIPRR